MYRNQIHHRFDMNMRNRYSSFDPDSTCPRSGCLWREDPGKLVRDMIMNNKDRWDYQKIQQGGNMRKMVLDLKDTTGNWETQKDGNTSLEYTENYQGHYLQVKREKLKKRNQVEKKAAGAASPWARMGKQGGDNWVRRDFLE
eukprot:Gb_01626 [translate_table: standard]